jgi:hypothetical protein
MRRLKRSIAFLFILSLSVCFAGSDSYKEKGKGPLKVFILAGQSNMVGHGLSEHIKIAASDSATQKEFGPLMNGGQYAVREDVWITFGGRKGGLSVGYGASDSKIGPEIGFGWHMGELLKEQVLIIKTCWGGHSLKEKFLPPSMGGPGPSYTNMVKEVKNTLKNLKSNFPGYSARSGYEITGLVWHQAWNDLVDGEQYGENPSYKTYSERQGALLRDLRKELNAPNMFMVIGELGVEASTNPKHVAFRKAQEATTLMSEFKKTTRIAKTCQFWDPDEKFKSNGGYHYNGNGKIYYFKGKAMAEAMYELMPKLSFADVSSLLDARSKPAYNAIRSKKYAQAIVSLNSFKSYLDKQKTTLPEKKFKTLGNVYELLQDKVNGVVDPAISDIKQLRANKDYYGISKKYTTYSRILKGIPEFDELTIALRQEMKSKAVANERKLGRLFYDYISRAKKSEERNKGPRTLALADRYKRYLESKILQRTPGSIYARAAMKASEELQNLKNPILEPGDYISKIVVN